MTLGGWAQSGWLRTHEPSRQEIAEILAVADRDLADSGIKALSTDARFSLAYSAALQSAVAALAAAGYRAGRQSHHHYVMQSLAHTIKADARSVAQFDAFRKKRNIAGYERVGAVSEQEAEEMRELARQLRERVEEWIRAEHADLLEA